MSVGVVELRQYLLHPGRREDLVRLFEAELVDSQEAVGMRVLGIFRDLDRPDHFVWLRGFADLAGRAPALGAFYGGPVWKANSGAANATMIDSDDVLLLRPVSGRLDAGAGTAADGVVTITVYPAAGLDRATLPPAVAVLETDPGPNDFPALPVREGEDVVVRVARGDTAPPLAERAVQHLRLAPTDRSPLR